jgi:hypothetical protein
MLPPEETIILAPTGRGAEPATRITVATAIRWPEAYQAWIWDNRSIIVFPSPPITGAFCGGQKASQSHFGDIASQQPIPEQESRQDKVDYVALEASGTARGA